MNDKESARAICPYYKSIRDRQIQCESCVKKTRQVFVFKSQGEAIRHKRMYCDSYNWELCEYAEVLNKIWTLDFRRRE